MEQDGQMPAVSVVVLNYNGAKWIRRCIESLFTQTIFAGLELIVADNASSDGSDKIAEQMLNEETRCRFIQHGVNLGFCDGNNRAAAHATGEYLFFLNNDAWLENDCLEVLLAETKKAGAAAATPYVMNWADNEFQWVYVAGFDIVGLPSFRVPPQETEQLFMPPGCSYLIRRDLFDEIGRFDADFFMYADEYDLSWRVWISGESAVVVPRARMHHRGAADVNPAGGERIVTYQTSVTKRYFTNRNCLLTLLKNCQHILLILALLQILIFMAEAGVALVLVRNWHFVRKSYFEAIRDALRFPKLSEERNRVRKIRKRSDLFMLKFLRFRLNRWDEFLQLRKMGVPKVVSR
jgi:GT2 family glycosyltransferase